MGAIGDNLQAVRARIVAAAVAAGREPSAIGLLAVSKIFSAEAVAEACASGQRAFGESYVQEAVDKILQLAGCDIEWHFIGPIQSNKTRLVAEHFDWVQSLDRTRIAERLHAQRPAHLPPLQVCIQVNTDGGPTKAGVAPADVVALAEAIRSLPRLRLRGLMTIPEPAVDFSAARTLHVRARELFDALNAGGLGLDTLSMGMSADLDAAIDAGSTMVRVGSAIFGQR